MQSYYIHESHRWHFTCVLDGKPIRFFCVFIRDSHSCLWHYLGPTEGLIHGFLSLATMICPVKLLTACCLSINHFPLAATVHPELWNPFPLKKKSMNQTVDVWVWAFIICCFLMSQGPRLWMIGGQMLRRLEQSWNINPQKSAPATPVTKPAFYLIMVAFSRPWYITERQQQVVFPRDVIFCITALSFWAVPCVRKNPGREGNRHRPCALGKVMLVFWALVSLIFLKPGINCGLW